MRLNSFLLVLVCIFLIVESKKKKKEPECKILPLGHFVSDSNSKRFSIPKSHFTPSTSTSASTSASTSTHTLPSLDEIAKSLDLRKDVYHGKYMSWCDQETKFYDVKECFSQKCNGTMWIGHEGDIWTWVLEPGQTRSIKAADRDLTLVALSKRPNILFVENFLTDEESLILVEKGEPIVTRSKVRTPQGDALTQGRTSSNGFLYHNNVTILNRIDKSIEKLLGLPAEIIKDSSGYQIVRYHPTQKYVIHHDSFDSDENNEIGVACGRNRFVTVLFYLNEVEGGGETYFPMHNKLVPYVPFNECPNEDLRQKERVLREGLHVSPKKNSAVIFYDLNPKETMNGKLDEWAYHAGCPVEKGIKWAANRWVYNKILVPDTVREANCKENGFPYGWGFNYPRKSQAG